MIEHHTNPSTETGTKFLVSVGTMNLILMAVEHGFREHERGKNLQGALASVYDLYAVAPDNMRGR